MNIGYETFPDDLRLRYNLCKRFLLNATSFPPHFSHPYTVVASFIKGKAEIVFAERGTPPLLLRAGDTCILPANCRRHSKAGTPGGVEFIAAGFLFEVRGGIDFLSFFDVPLRPDKSTGNQLHSLLKELLGLETNPHNRTDLQITVSRQRIGYALLERILAVSAPKPGMFSMRRLLPAIEYLNANFNTRTDLPNILKISGLSRTHFFRLFKSQTGTTPLEYIKRCRLREALLLLQESDLNISEVGDKVGWPDPAHFSKIFKSKIGLAPSAYRFQISNMEDRKSSNSSGI